MLKLPDITVCAADTAAPELAARALERCLDQCEFGDAILFSDRPVAGRFRTVAVPTMRSIDDYSRFCLKGMAQHIATDFALVVQWDGYVVDAGSWASGFRKYDYIGAPIPQAGGALVGNGGFSLRSRKLLAALPALPDLPGVAEDHVISGIGRKQLEADFGVRIAPVALAERFSHELRQPTRRTFGFHGPANLLLYESDAEILDIYGHMPPRAFLAASFFVVQLMCRYLRRRDLAIGLYAVARAHHPPEALMREWSRAAAPQDVRAAILDLERAIKPGSRWN